MKEDNMINVKKLEKKILEKWKEKGMIKNTKDAKISVNALCFLLSDFGLNDLIKLVIDTDEIIREVCATMADEIILKKTTVKPKRKEKSIKSK